MTFEDWWGKQNLWHCYKDAALQAWNAAQQADRESNDEPVGYLTYIEDAGLLFTQDEPESGCYEPIYTRPTPARKPLSEDEIEKEFDRRCELDCCPDFSEAVRWAEKMHGIGEEE